MKFTTRGRYGLRAAFVLAQGWGGPPVALKDIAASQHLAEKYLDQNMKQERAKDTAIMITSEKVG